MDSPISILGVPISPLSVDQLHRQIYNVVAQSRKAIFLYANIQALNIAHENEWLRQFYQQAECVICDGAGIRLAALFYGRHLPARITYADWIWQLAEYAEAKGLSLYCLGARPGIVDRAIEQLRNRYPGIRVVGASHGFFEKTVGGTENSEVVQAINTSRPNILLVGFGVPIQERWVLENYEKLDVNVIIVGGAVFDYISGELRRGPRWMTNHGLEWLARMLIEPRRLWRRYIYGIPVFFWRVLHSRH